MTEVAESEIKPEAKEEPIEDSIDVRITRLVFYCGAKNKGF